MDFQTLLKKNPWWKGKEYFEQDPDYSKLTEAELQWDPELENKIELAPFSLNFLFGPRQAGKTTALKLLIKKTIENKDPKSVFYFNCDEIGDYKELKDVLEEYLIYREREGIDSSLIILDEITAPNEWWRTIKSLIDDATLSKDVLILTGSASIEVKKQTEYFPGRRGKGKDYTMYPLSFKKYVDVVDPDLSKKLTGKPSKDIVFLEEINKLLKDYFISGGFPLAINSYHRKRRIPRALAPLAPFSLRRTVESNQKNGKVEDDIKSTYLAWVKNDLTKTGKDERIAREIIKVLLGKMPSPLSFEGIASETSIKSPKTIASYLHTLSDLFVLELAYFIDPNTEVIQFGKNKKIELIDPLLFQIFEDWGLVEIKEKESVIAESVLAVHLYRKYKNIFYWSGKEEIDCVIQKENKLMGYECKWKEKAKEKKIKVGRLKEVYTISKKDFGGKIIPLSLFLYALEK